MAQRAKRGNILSFFKPVERPPKSEADDGDDTRKKPEPSASPSKSTSHPHSHSHSYSHSPSSSPRLPSSPLSRPRTPVRACTPTKRRAEIQASDDDGDDDEDSDDSLEDLSALLSRARPGNAGPSPMRPVRNPLATPKAKRTAVAFHSSPLAIMPKHKFDLKALAKDAQKDEATTNASSRRDKTVADVKPGLDAGGAASTASRRTLEGIVKSEGGQDAQRVIRAVQRSEPGQSQLRYCFFEENYKPPSAAPAPKRVSKGPWKLVTQGNEQVRERNMASGIPQTVLLMEGGLPDELFDWILNDLCIRQSRLLQTEYCTLLGLCPEQIERKLTPERLRTLFQRLGATADLDIRETELPVSNPAAEPYEDRDWSCVGAFLGFLGIAVPHLSVESVVFAIQTLIRMSLDQFLMYNVDLLMDYEHAMQLLLDAIPRPNWDTFCYETCLLIHGLVKAQCIRINPLVCLPAHQARSHDLRRRLAVAFLFDDPGLGRHHPDDIVTIKGLIHRLEGADFTVSQDTDFAELRACIILLNIAVDDGSFVPSDDGKDEEKLFNAEVDELSARLGAIWRKINDAGMKLARTETKTVIDWVQKRLAHSVRTKKKAKASIFDLPRQDDPFLPRQQGYMQSFLKKAAAAPAPAPSPKPQVDEAEDSDTIVVKTL